MTTTLSTRPDDTALLAPGTPVDAVLRGSLLAAPLLFLAADATYAARSWQDGAGGVLHVLGATAYALVVLAVAGRLPAASRLAAALLVVGALGAAGNVAYGFEAIHGSLGDVALVDRDGAAALIKPLGLAFPLTLLLVAASLRRLGLRWQAAVVAVAGALWPVAHIADLSGLAVALDVALLAALGSTVPRPAARD